MHSPCGELSFSQNPDKNVLFRLLTTPVKLSRGCDLQIAIALVGGLPPFIVLPRRGLVGNLESLKHQKKLEVYHGSLSSRERSEQWWNKDKRST